MWLDSLVPCPKIILETPPLPQLPQQYFQVIILQLLALIHLCEQSNARQLSVKRSDKLSLLFMSAQPSTQQFCLNSGIDICFMQRSCLPQCVCLSLPQHLTFVSLVSTGSRHVVNTLISKKDLHNPPIEHPLTPKYESYSWCSLVLRPTLSQIKKDLVTIQ